MLGPLGCEAAAGLSPGSHSTAAPAMPMQFQGATGWSNSYAPSLGPNANGGNWSRELRAKKLKPSGGPKRSGPPSFMARRSALPSPPLR